MKANLVLINGEVMTPAGWKQGVAVAGDGIVAVGSNSVVESRAARGARIIDLHGETVMPGLFDMHVHPLLAGIELSRCRIPQGSDGAKLLSILSACVAQKKPGEWVAGGEWDASALGSTPLHRRTLDSVSPNNPVVLYDTSKHSNWANTAALKAAGIDRNTPDPPGGIIERDADGEPTGVLRESAGALVRSKLPLLSPTQNDAALKRALSLLVSYGVTSLTDAIITPDSLASYASLADKGELAPRVRGCLVQSTAWAPPGAFEKMLATRSQYQRDRFKPDCVKLFMDGVPTDSKTAAMLAPYEGSSETGMLMIPQDQLNAMVTRFDKMGLVVKFHAAGDAGAHAAFDAIAAARAANGNWGPTHDVAHLTFVSPADFARAKSIRATLEFSPYLWFPAPIVDDIIKVVGHPRIDRAWAVKEGLASGALVVAGSDWSVVPSANPWIGIETLVTRRKPGDPNSEAFAPQEAITLKQAIDIFTINGAKQMGMGNRLGSIEPGKLADLIVLDRNPFNVPITEVHATRTLMSIVGGKEVYDGTSPEDAQ